MVEGFKITASKIKRILKLAIHLPDDYYHSDKKYPLLLVFEGGLFFNFLTEDNKIIDLKTILDKYDKEFITIGLFSPKLPEWNISELDPYYSGDNESVDTSYSSIYFDYIVNDLLPLLNQKYRFDDNITLLGINTGALAIIPFMSKYEIIKKGIMISPSLNITNNLIINDLDKIKNKVLYIYLGEKDTDLETLNMFYKIEKESINKDLRIILDYNTELDNSTSNIEKHIKKGLELI